MSIKIAPDHRDRQAFAGSGRAGSPAGPAFTETLTLRDLGISKQQLSDSQKLAATRRSSPPAR
jgi:hypothetical protein